MPKKKKGRTIRTVRKQTRDRVRRYRERQRKLKAPKHIDFRAKGSPRYKEPALHKKVRKIFAKADKKIEKALG